jgi:plasmid stabilization system protein ParE
VKLFIAPAALAELQAAAAFYVSSANVQLGRAFLAEFERKVNLVAATPDLGTLIRGSLRRIPLRRFPYNLIYQTKSDEMRVLAVAHQRRRPGYWKIRK